MVPEIRLSVRVAADGWVPVLAELSRRRLSVRRLKTRFTFSHGDDFAPDWRVYALDLETDLHLSDEWPGLDC